VRAPHALVCAPHAPVCTHNHPCAPLRQLYASFIILYAHLSEPFAPYRPYSVTRACPSRSRMCPSRTRACSSSFRSCPPQCVRASPDPCMHLFLGCNGSLHLAIQRGSHHGQTNSGFILSKVNMVLTLIRWTSALLDRHLDVTDMSDGRTHRQP
jgi:hypothetical protein